uniref:Uncharacterized protein n=1 Tax=Anguilla anguilla TaxID=7936 RepID=A0A0E9RAA1_ANGAN
MTYGFYFIEYGAFFSGGFISLDTAN